MTRRQRLRRVGILCCYFIGNLAFYRAWHIAGRPRQNEHFWVAANGAFLDIAVLEWCKLFGDPRGKHYWAKVVTNADEFRAGLLHRLAISNAAFDTYIREMRTYRDRFVAHLDDDEQMQIPRLRIARRSTTHLYDHLVAVEDNVDAFHDAPPNLVARYRRFLAEARRIYAQ
jgi:hypothetical protein